MKSNSSPYFKPLAALFVICCLALVARVINLTHIPVFADEAIYLRWSQIMRAEPTLRFLPLSDGKQPLFMWLTIPFYKIFSDPLFAGRFVSALSGVGTIVGISLLTWLLFQDFSLAILTSFLAATSPFLVFFDRFALVDSLLTMLGVWTLVTLLTTAKLLRLDAAMIAGGFLGLALLTKTPAQVFILLSPLAFFLFSPARPKIKLAQATILWLVFLGIGLAMYNILRLGPEFHMVALRNRDYVFSFSDVLHHPLDPLLPNTRTSFSYLLFFLTPPVLFLSLGGALFLYKKYPREIILLLLISLLPLLGQAAIARVLTARYLLYVVPYFLILSAAGLNRLVQKTRTKSTFSFLLFLFVFLAWPFILALGLVFRPETLNLPRSEKTGYFELWTSGYGIKEAADYLRARGGDNRQIVVGAEGFFGTLPDGLEIYLNDYKNIRIIGSGIHIERVPDSLENAVFENEVYLLVNRSRFFIPDPQKAHLELIAAYPKIAAPDGTQDELLFFRVLGSNNADNKTI